LCVGGGVVGGGGGMGVDVVGGLVGCVLFWFCGFWGGGGWGVKQPSQKTQGRKRTRKTAVGFQGGGLRGSIGGKPGTKDCSTRRKSFVNEKQRGTEHATDVQAA